MNIIEQRSAYKTLKNNIAIESLIKWHIFLLIRLRPTDINKKLDF